MSVFIPKNYKSTAEIPVPEKTIDQVIGQDKSVELIRKAAIQKRNVLLVGLPGTGKSMLAQAMAEILPVQRLEDILVYPNNSDPNNPRIRIVKAGEGKKIVNEARIEALKEASNVKMIGLILPLSFFIISFFLWWMGWISPNPVAAAVIFAASLVLGGFLLIAFALSMQIKTRESIKTPKLLVDNSNKKTAPFIEATGAKAGALLGDVKHDPLQSFIDEVQFTVCRNGIEERISFAQLWNQMSEKYPDRVKEYEDGYEAIVFPDSEEVYAYGVNDKMQVIKTRIVSMNRRPYEDEVIEISAGKSKLTVTPEHKILTKKGDRKAEQLSESNELLKLVQSELTKIYN